jgi:hypothetical protein
MHTGDKGLSRRIFETEGEAALQKHKEKKQKELHERIQKNFYIIYDLIDFPEIRYRIIHGKKLYNLFPKGKINYSQREVFFG